ncbi:ATP-binding protein [Adlercreutzia sp. ZJ141]|uniref:ATP-binding protein n=1 Tax=Adlercreutzia sp. ZJ141 TaxID=2709406 RepID=UPI00197F1CC9|nr:ATP-binding protein [Adlercreutzia sp. ZJ141]
MALANPFTPTFGRVPLLMAGRLNIINEMERAFENGPGDPNLSTIFTGPRGTGKTALLLYLSRIASAHGWISVNVAAIPGMLEDIIERTRDAAAEFIDTSEPLRIKGLTIGQLLGIEWETGVPQLGNWRTRMTHLLDALASQNIGLLITVDEVRPDLDEMVQLATVYQHFVGEERAVALILAGLPGKVSSLLRNESVSFLRRSNRHRLGNIPDDDIAEGIRLTIEEGGRHIEAEALEKAVEASDGFPYLMQLVGFQSWAQHPDLPIVSSDDVDAGISLAKKNFSERVLEATYYDLSEKDLAFLQAMLADKSDSRLADIAKRLCAPSNYTSTYKRRLIEQGVIGERGRSYLVFELPGFREYLLEKLDPIS